MIDILEQLLKQLNDNQPAVLASIISCSGSTPRGIGAKMLISPTKATKGTIGGGRIELEVIRAGYKLYRGRQNQIIHFNLSEHAKSDAIGMFCGGEVSILIEYIEPTQEQKFFFAKWLQALKQRQTCLSITALPDEKTTRIAPVRCLVFENGETYGRCEFVSGWIKERIYKKLYLSEPFIITEQEQRFLIEPIKAYSVVFIFGAGHIAGELVPLLRRLEFRTVVLDDRPEFANAERFPQADEIIVLKSFEEAFNYIEVNDNSYLVIVTHGHLFDQVVLSKALTTKPKYIGMIGSIKKRDTIYNHLIKEGFLAENLKKVHSPIGLEIEAKTPAEIAVSIAAELVAVRAGKMKEASSSNAEKG